MLDNGIGFAATYFIMLLFIGRLSLEYWFQRRFLPRQGMEASAFA